MRYLTKSRFKMAMDCPTKLFYTKKPDEYADNSQDDPFMKSLAEGGFQVGELAKCYFPDGIEIEGLNAEKTWEETKKHLEKENVTLFEAAIKYKNLFVRIDILKKTGNKIELIEVKAKSLNSSSFQENLWQKRNKDKLNSDYVEYVYDVAFQAYVLGLAFPQFEVKSFLMGTDKDSVATINGLNQKFLICRDENNGTKIERMGDVNLTALGDSILAQMDISEAVFKIHNNIEATDIYQGMNFQDAVAFFADHYEKDVRIAPEVSNSCKGCEFRTSEDSKKSGFNECWNLCHGLSEEELDKPFSFDVWFSPKLSNERIFMEDIVEGDFTVKPPDTGDGLSRSQRQWLQIEKVKNDDLTEWRDQDGITRLFSTFKYPLHFIDFETCMVAIPFNKGRRPYEQVAFQFSHHELYEDGTYVHAGEWIETTPGKFPNFDFVRELKSQLGKDEGTIFRYSNHENTVFNQIIEQLRDSEECDKNELISWIQTITSNSKENRVGPRTMVDLCEVVKKFYYHPQTGGSNSIKYVLPAILTAQGKNEDPYKKLPPTFDKNDCNRNQYLMKEDSIANGGAALSAYALMQFTQMSAGEREKIKQALLRYCKLDTEAMVWIYQYLKKAIKE